MMNPVVAQRGLEGVGVRELRQNLSVYLDRVKLGETLNVTASTGCAWCSRAGNPKG